jgi:hypothetical protein
VKSLSSLAIPNRGLTRKVLVGTTRFELATSPTPILGLTQSEQFSAIYQCVRERETTRRNAYWTCVWTQAGVFKTNAIRTATSLDTVAADYSCAAAVFDSRVKTVSDDAQPSSALTMVRYPPATSELLRRHPLPMIKKHMLVPLVHFDCRLVV